MQSSWLVLPAAFGVALLLTVSAYAQMPPQPVLSHSYVSHSCGIRFNYPEKWKVVAAKDCAFKIQPLDIQKHVNDDHKADNYSIELKVGNGFLEAAATEAGFYRNEGKWEFQGEEGAPAEPISVETMKGLLARDFACRMYNRQGYVGLGDCAAAILAGNSRVASFYANPQSLDLLPKLVRSFRFVATVPALPSKQSSK